MPQPLPRLTFEELDPALARLLEPRVRRLGYLGEFFRCAAHQPRALSAFVEFTESAKAPLDKRLVELVALTVATAKRNPYECNQHERLSVRLGYGRDWVADVERLSPDDAPSLSDAERELQRFVLAAVGERADAATAFQQVVARHGAQDAVALLMVVGRYAAHAVMVNALRLAPPVPSVFEDGFNGDGVPPVASARAPLSAG